MNGLSTFILMVFILMVIILLICYGNIGLLDKMDYVLLDGFELGL